jgi:hypothetical protein
MSFRRRPESSRPLVLDCRVKPDKDTVKLTAATPLRNGGSMG